jgi:hypothetical protein
MMSPKIIKAIKLAALDRNEPAWVIMEEAVEGLNGAAQVEAKCLKTLPITEGTAGGTLNLRASLLAAGSYLMVGFLLCVVAVSAIWLIAFEKPKPLKLAPVPTHPQSPRLKMPTEQLRPGETKATIPKDLMDRLK